MRVDLIPLIILGAVVIFLVWICISQRGRDQHENFYQEQWTCDQCTKNCDAGDFNLCTILCQDSCSKQGCHYTCLMSGGDPKHCHGKGTCAQDGQGCPCATYSGCLWECSAHGSGQGGIDRVKKCNEICHAEYIGTPESKTKDVVGDL